MKTYTSLFLTCFAMLFSLSICAIDFPLPESNYIPAKMPMHLIYPRPDTETQSHARHRWAHPNMRYEIPIGVQGGAWPFKYELITAPSGASIGALYGDENYGVITWSPPASGTFDFKVKITDQELNSTTAEWKVTVDANRFVFIQDGWEGSKTGTIDEPLEDISDWYKNDRNDDTFHNKIVVLRAGNYSLIGDPDNNNNVRLDASSKTPSLIGFPNETPIIDASQAKVLTDDGNGLQDLFIAGIRWENSRQDVNNAHFIWATGNVSRATFWNNYFFNHGPGINGNDNTAAVFISNKSTHKQYVLYKGNTHDQFTNTGSNGAYVDIYYTSYVLIEENIAKNSDNTYGFWAKGTTSFVSIRANQAYENISGGGIVVGYGTESPLLVHDHEVCWNRIVLNSSSGNALLFAMESSYSEQSYNSFIYRNTFVNGSAWVRFPGREPYLVDGNVVVNDKLYRWNTDVMSTTLSNLVGNTSSGYVDSTGRLSGVSRQNYLGVLGFEVSDTTSNKIPKPPSSVQVQ